MGTHSAQAEIWNADGQLVATAVAEVKWEGNRWWGVLTVEAAPIDWFGQDLSLRMGGHPSGRLFVEHVPAQTVGGVHLVHFRGSGLPPFWDRRPKAELIEELRNRRPVAGALGPGGEVPVWHDESNQQIRDVLKDRDGMTDAEIDEAIES